MKLLWHDGVGMSLYLKRLEAGKFIWPASQGGTAVAISAAQLGLAMLDAALQIAELRAALAAQTGSALTLQFSWPSQRDGPRRRHKILVLTLSLDLPRC